MRPLQYRNVPVLGRAPRARGDAPFVRALRRIAEQVPPRARGCALKAKVGALPPHGSPARAGMRPSLRCAATSPTGCPRARGDAPKLIQPVDQLVTVPPRARGCARVNGMSTSAPRGSPARAGMRPGTWGSATPRSRFPRARGDAPLVSAVSTLVLVVPPRARGCALWPAGGAALESGSPARAGMRPCGSTPRRPASRFPRARGDAPFSLDPKAAHHPVPPRARGCALVTRLES